MSDLSISRILRWSFSVLILGSACAGSAIGASTREEFLALVQTAERGEIRPLEAARPNLPDPAQRAIAELEIGASRLDAHIVQKALSAFLDANDDDPDHASAAWSAVAGVAFANAEYSEAADASRHWLAALAASDPRHESADAAQVLALATVLAAAPRMTIDQAPSATETFRDKAGLARARVSLNGIGQEAVLDTGANLSVLSETAATRLHVRILDGAASVGSASRAAVPVRIGVADELRIGGTTLRNVAFLILEDKQLQLPLPGGYAIDAIIGFPVFRAIGSIRFENARFAMGNAVPAEGAARMTARGSDLFVEATVNGVPVALHLDTGASDSSLSPAFAASHRSIIEKEKVSRDRIAGAGGITARDIIVWKPARIEVGGQTAMLPGIAITVQESAEMKTQNYGTLGQDFLKKAGSFSVDFRSMLFRAGD